MDNKGVIMANKKIGEGKTVNDSYRIPETLRDTFKKRCPNRTGSRVVRKLIETYLDLVDSGFNYDHFIINDWKLEPIKNIEKDPFLEEVKGVLSSEEDDQEYLEEEITKPAYPFKR